MRNEKWTQNCTFNGLTVKKKIGRRKLFHGRDPNELQNLTFPCSNNKFTGKVRVPSMRVENKGLMTEK